VAAIVCGMELSWVFLGVGRTEGASGECMWKPQGPSRPHEVDLMVMALAGLIATKTGRDKRLARPSGADYIFRADQDLKILSALIEAAYERYRREQDPHVPGLDRKTFHHLRFEEAWSEAAARLTLPPCVRSVKKIAGLLVEKRFLAGEEVKKIVFEESAPRQEESCCSSLES